MKGDVPVDLGDLAVIVGAHGLLDLVVNAGRKAIAAKQRRWNSVVEEGQVIGTPGLQCRPHPKAKSLVFVLPPPFCYALRRWAGDLKASRENG